MNHRIWFLVCAVLGLLMLVAGLAVPVHLRAVDAAVIQHAGANTTALVDQGMEFARQNNLGAAQLTLRAARDHGLPDWEKLALAVNNLASAHPDWQAWGGGTPHLDHLLKPVGDSSRPDQAPEPLTEWAIRSENRETCLALIESSAQPVLRELLRFRAVTNTALFPPSTSASGQALDAAIVICGLLLEERSLAPDLSNTVFAAASTANRGGNTERFEGILMDLMSLGQRLNWSQLAAFVAPFRNAETLRLQANLVRRADNDLPVVFSAVVLSGNPEAVARYVLRYSRTGLKDLGWTLRCGAGGVTELVRREQPLYISSVRPGLASLAPAGFVMDVAATLGWQMPGVALALKWLFYLFCGFLLAAAAHCALPEVSVLERPLQVRGFHFAREALFGLGFLVVVLLLSEPFLAQESQKVDLPFRLRLPTVGATGPVGNNGVSKLVMNSSDFLPLVLFFVLQGLLYTACLVKLAEIRRQRVAARVKLRLLENEEHLFDAGLYLGFLGTIVSFILYSTGVMKQFSLMVAYSSTSFGIVFVSLFKILHLRSARRRLVLEAENAAATADAGARASAYAVSS